MKITSQDGTSIEIFTKSDIETLLFLSTKLLPKKNEFLDYDLNRLRQYYYDDNIRWLEMNDNSSFAPYEIVFDYRENTLEDWGKFTYGGDFKFPSELYQIKNFMVDKFTKKGLLYKGDNSCPRIKEVINEKQSFKIHLQKSSYYDQVATNLTMDYKHDEKMFNFKDINRLRDWDIKQSKTKMGLLPSFTNSKLANTIGVALGITAKNKYGQSVILARKRTSSVAVYQNMIHLPFSFSLNFESKMIIDNQYHGSIKELIKPDFRFEQAEELGLEPGDIDMNDVKPLIFCRDIIRGGKPQFFLEIEMKVPYEELKHRIEEQAKTKKEYKGTTIGMTISIAKKFERKFSPELLAFMLTKIQEK